MDEQDHGSAAADAVTDGGVFADALEAAGPDDYIPIPLGAADDKVTLKVTDPIDVFGKTGYISVEYTTSPAPGEELVEEVYVRAREGLYLAWRDLASMYRKEKSAERRGKPSFEKES